MSKDVCRAKLGSSGGKQLLNAHATGAVSASLAIGNCSIAGAKALSATMPVPSTMQLL